MGHIGDGFLRVRDPINSVKALNEDVNVVTFTFKAYQVGLLGM